MYICNTILHTYMLYTHVEYIAEFYCLLLLLITKAQRNRK